jgi:ribonuclease HI
MTPSPKSKGSGAAPAGGKPTRPDSSDAAPGTYCLFTDGGSRGNPGPAAAGIVITDPAGRVIHSSGHFIGRATNNIAEYRAMIFGLEEAHRRGIAQLKVCSDSELMVHQINGVYRVKNEFIRPLYAQVMELLQKFRQVRVEHIRREGNTLADDMANRAMDARADVRGPSAGALEPCDESTSAGPAAAAALDKFTAHCTAESDDQCPGVVSAGGDWPFAGTVPPGLCQYAAAGIVEAVLDAPPGTATITASCARPGCPARFQIRFSRTR